MGGGITATVLLGVGRGEAERRETQKLSGMEQPRAPCPETPPEQEGVSAGTRLPGSSLGLEAGLAGPREGHGPAEVMGSDGTCLRTSWASPPVPEEGM